MAGPDHHTDDTTAPEPVHDPQPAAPALLANPRRRRLAHVSSDDELLTTGTNSD